MSNSPWRPVPGHEDYEVSDTGAVWSNRTQQFLTPTPMPQGYLSVMLGPGNRRLVHRLVLEAFVGPAPAGHETRHLNGNPADNNLSNLRWGTAQENHQDKVRHGTHLRVKCPFGHPLATPNLSPYYLRRGVRRCAACVLAEGRITSEPKLRKYRNLVGNVAFEHIMVTGHVEGFDGVRKLRAMLVSAP